MRHGRTVRAAGSVAGRQAAARAAAVGRCRTALALYALAAVVLRTGGVAVPVIETGTAPVAVVAVIPIVTVQAIVMSVVPGVIIPGAVPSPVVTGIPAVVAVPPGTIVPGIIVPGVPGVPGIPSPTAVVPGAVMTVMPAPGAVVPGIIPHPGGCGVHDRQFVAVEQNRFTGRHNEGIPFTDNIGGRLFALGKEIVHFLIGHADLRDGYLGTGIQAIVVNPGLETGSGRAGNGKGRDGECQE